MSIAATPACGRINEVVVYFLRLGLVGFGGPVALVGQMERELVTERKWLTKEQMREAIAICQSWGHAIAHRARMVFATLLRHSSCDTEQAPRRLGNVRLHFHSRPAALAR